MFMDPLKSVGGTALIILAGVKGRKVAAFGVPTAAGASRSGLERGPFALREAGLLRALAARGLEVVNLSDLSLFPYRDDEAHPGARNAEGVACALRATADETTRAVREGFTLVLGGDCTIVAGTLAGLGRALGPVGLVYLDANADLNTPETSPSGRLSGMALAVALGRGPEEVVSAAGPPPAVRPEHVALLGFRALDPGERGALGELGLALPSSAARRLGMRAAAAIALDGVENGDGPILVHLDVDVIDPAEMPAKNEITPGPGLTVAEVSDLLTALLASPRVVALEVAEYAPDRDPGGQAAARIVDLVARAVSRRLRA
jgi:arginase